MTYPTGPAAESNYPYARPSSTPTPPKKKSKAWIWISVAVVSVLVICGMLGAAVLFAADDAAKQAGLQDGIAAAESPVGEPTTETADQNVTAKVGETLTVTGDATEKWTLVKTEQHARDEWGDKAGKGIYLALQMKVTVTDGSAFICSCSMQFIGPDNTVYDPTYRSIKNHDELPSTDTGNGQKVAGWVVFDLPKSALKGGRIQLKPNVWDDVYGYWAL